MKRLARTGITVRVRSRLTSMEMTMVIASGRNSFPSIPVRLRMGISEITMMTTPERMGTETSFAAAARMASLERLSPDCASSAWSRAWMFSTMTTAESTRIPMAIAIPPSDIRLAVRSIRFMTRKAPSTVRGRIVPTVIALRRFPRKRMRTMRTRATAWMRAVRTVETAVLMSSERS